MARNDRIEIDLICPDRRGPIMRLTDPRNPAAQGRAIADYRQRIAEAGLSDKPIKQSLCAVLVDQPDALPLPIHGGHSIRH